jgi:flagellar biogenesis protein FliO
VLALGAPAFASGAAADPPPPAPAPAAGPAPPPAEAPGAQAPALPFDEDVNHWSDFAASAVKMVAALGLIAATGYLAARLVGPRIAATRARSDDLIKVLEVKRLDPKTTLYLVEVAGKTTLIGVSENEVRSLVPLEIDEERLREAIARREGSGTAARGEPAEPGNRAFAEILGRKAGKG